MKSSMESADVLRAIANERRLQILSWLKNPRKHFPPQIDGDLVEDGVCALFIAEKLGVTPSTLSEHMRLLSEAGLVTAKRIKQWTFYKRNDKAVAAMLEALKRDI